MNRNNTPIKC